MNFNIQSSTKTFCHMTLVVKDRMAFNEKDAVYTVPIRRNLTGNTCENAFCFRSIRVPVPVLHLFCIRSISVLFPFCICSMLFCSHSVRDQSVSVLETRSGERGFWEIVSKISDTHLHVTKLLKLLRYKRIRTINLNFRGENMRPVFWKKKTGRWYCIKLQVSLEKVFFRNDTKRPVVCVIFWGKEVNQLAKLSALVFTRMLLARFNIEVSPQTVTNAAQTWL